MGWIVTLQKQTYRGLCIGGPADGHLREHTINWFLAVKLNEKWIAFAPGDPVPSGDVTTTVQYDYMAIPLQVGGKLVQYGFWVTKGQDAGYVMRQLITSYERKEGMKK